MYEIPLREEILHPFGRGKLTSDGIQWSSEVATSDDELTEVEKVTVELPNKAAEIYQVELGLTMAYKSSGATKDVKFKWQARNKDGTWVDLHDLVTIDNPGTSYIEDTRSGYFASEGNFNQVPFDVRLVIQREDSGENATAKVKNSSYIRILCL